MKSAIITLALPLIALCGIGADSPKADDQKNMQGTWAVVSATQDGKAVEFGDEAVFAGDQLKFRGKDGREQKGTFKLDPTKKPKEFIFKPVDLPPNASPGQMAYELSGDTLKLVTSSPDKRPTEISDKGQILITLNRKKP